MPRPMKQEPPRVMPRLFTDMTVNERDRLWVDDAVEFSASIYAHRGKRAAHFVNLPMAVAQAAAFELEAENGRQAIVYAITERGHATVIVRPAWQELLGRLRDHLAAGGDMTAALAFALDKSLLPSDKPKR